jgi:chromosome segregation ATPase
MPDDERAPTIEQRLSALTSAIENTNEAFTARMEAFDARLAAEAQARAEFETLSQLRGKAIDARLDSQAMHIELLVHETHALGVKVDLIAEKVDQVAEKVDRVAGAVDTLKSVVTDLVKLATSHERRISTLEGASQ